MKILKKATAFTLSFFMLFSSTGPAFADNEKNFSDDAVKIYKNDIVDSDIDLNMNIDSTESVLNGQIKLKGKMEVQKKNDLTCIEIEVPKFVSDGYEKFANPPKIKLFIKKDGSMYIGREIVKYVLGSIAPEKMYSEDFVKINSNNLNADEQKLVSNMTFFAKDYIDIKDLVIKLMRNMQRDNLIDMKNEDGRYTLELNSNEAADLLYNYAKLTVSDFEHFKKFCEDANINLPLKEIEKNFDQERQYLLSYIENLKEKFMPFIKIITKDSNIKYTGDFKDGISKENLDVNIKINLNGMFEEKTNGIIKIDANVDSKAKEKASFSEPEKYYTVTEKDMEHIKKALMVMDVRPGDNLAEIDRFYLGKTEVELDAKVIKNRYYIQKYQMEDIFGINLDTDEDYVPIREVTKHGFFIRWENTGKNIFIYRDSRFLR